MAQYIAIIDKKKRCSDGSHKIVKFLTSPTIAPQKTDGAVLSPKLFEATAADKPTSALFSVSFIQYYVIRLIFHVKARMSRAD